MIKQCHGYFRVSITTGSYQRSAVIIKLYYKYIQCILKTNVIGRIIIIYKSFTTSSHTGFGSLTLAPYSSNTFTVSL